MSVQILTPEKIGEEDFNELHRDHHRFVIETDPEIGQLYVDRNGAGAMGMNQFTDHTSMARALNIHRPIGGFCSLSFSTTNIHDFQLGVKSYNIPVATREQFDLAKTKGVLIVIREQE